MKDSDAQRIADAISEKLGGHPGDVTFEGMTSHAGYSVRRSFVADGERYTQEYRLSYSTAYNLPDDVLVEHVTSQMVAGGLENAAWKVNPVPQESLSESCLREILIDIAHAVDHPGLRAKQAFSLRELGPMVRELKKCAAREGYEFVEQL